MPLGRYGVKRSRGPRFSPAGRPAAADLTRPDLRTHADGEIFWVIANGVPASGMPSSSLSETATWQLVAYVRTLGGVKFDVRPDDAPGERYVWDLPKGFPRPRCAIFGTAFLHYPFRRKIRPFIDQKQASRALKAYVGASARRPDELGSDDLTEGYRAALASYDFRYDADLGAVVRWPG